MIEFIDAEKLLWLFRTGASRAEFELRYMLKNPLPLMP
jgi:hypothetical protein